MENFNIKNIYMCYTNFNIKCIPSSYGPKIRDEIDTYEILLNTQYQHQVHMFWSQYKTNTRTHPIANLEASCKLPDIQSFSPLIT